MESLLILIPCPESAVGSTSRLAFASLQFQFPGVAPFTCQLLVKFLSTEYWYTLVKSLHRKSVFRKNDCPDMTLVSCLPWMLRNKSNKCFFYLKCHAVIIAARIEAHFTLDIIAVIYGSHLLHLSLVSVLILFLFLFQNILYIVFR